MLDVEVVIEHYSKPLAAAAVLISIILAKYDYSKWQQTDLKEAPC